MSKTIADVRQEQMTKYKTEKNKYSDFPVGTAVQIITPCQDFYFFYDETGIVIKNKVKYLGIIVKFGKPREFKDGYVQKEFNFEPSDLIKLSGSVCPHCGNKS